MTKRRYGDINNGFLDVILCELDAEDMKTILCKLASPRERRPRKCQRVDGTFNTILSLLPPPVPLLKLSFAVNIRIGDDGMSYLNLIPDTVNDLDLSGCGITPIGIQVLCEFLKTNTTIKRLVLHGNMIGDEGAKYIADMLFVNTNLEVLVVEHTQIGPNGAAHLSRALAHTRTLRELRAGGGEDLDMSDEFVKNLCPGLRLNSSLEKLDLGCLFEVTKVGFGYLEECLRNNYTLKHIAFRKTITNRDDRRGSALRKVKFWLSLNRLNRKLIRSEESTTFDWQEALIKSSKLRDASCSYYFLLKKPELCCVHY